MSRHKLRLYGTEHCHLCDEAEAILRKAGIEANYIEIAGDDVLVTKYGMRIPVLHRMDTDAELGWPFDAAMVARFLK